MLKGVYLGVCYSVIIISVIIMCRIIEIAITENSKYDAVRAYVSEEYYEQFDSMNYTLESFNLTNAKHFTYRYYPTYDEETEEEVMGYRFFEITLKKAGKRHVNNAVEQLKKLEFVTNAVFSSSGMLPGYLFE
ncbi:MAG: hypothetical protein CVU00_14245 [Bacteroidetes bacterium HGW-Bacteroidetes-17]|nr:MAG: hypothetical protein CVU00_14245 [Bacteroidetes bacterium HGW-Bacteroidetes-17]